MPASFKTLSGGSPLNVALNLAKSLAPTAGDLLYAAERQRARIITRTGRGVDVDGRAFTPYKPAYAARKAKTGRNSGTVDLTWSGRMLQALVSRAGGREISGRAQSVGLNDSPAPVNFFTIGIYGSEAVRAAAINAGAGKMPQRRFIGASSQDERAMISDIVARIKARALGTALNAA